MCASGVETGYLINQGADVVGIDISEKMIEIGNKKLNNIQLIIQRFIQLRKTYSSFNDADMIDGIKIYKPLLKTYCCNGNQS